VTTKVPERPRFMFDAEDMARNRAESKARIDEHAGDLSDIAERALWRVEELEAQLAEHEAAWERMVSDGAVQVATDVLGEDGPALRIEIRSVLAAVRHALGRWDS
jgi:hypothetical protein